MEERLTKIAEASFRKAMAKFSSWGDIGIALKNVQSEIREVSKRTRGGLKNSKNRVDLR